MGQLVGGSGPARLIFSLQGAICTPFVQPGVRSGTWIGVRLALVPSNSEVCLPSILSRKTGKVAVSCATVTEKSVIEGPLADSTPLTGRQPEPVNYQAARSDPRRISGSCGTATLHLRPMFAKPPYRAAARTCRPVKGVLNRRFKRVFGYFCRVAKVPEESGGEKLPG